MSNLGQTNGRSRPPVPGTGADKGLRIVVFFSVTFLATMVILTGLAWHTWRSYRQLKIDQTRNFRTIELAGVITHLDEVLTMSARMAVATGDLQWEKRYRVFEPQLDAALQEAMGLWPDVFISDAVSQTNLANIKLVDMENRAFDLVRQGDRAAAAEILYGAEYEKQKQAYSNGMQQVAGSLHGHVRADVGRNMRVALTIIGLIGLLLVLTLGIWLYALRTLRRYVAPPG